MTTARGAAAPAPPRREAPPPPPRPGERPPAPRPFGERLPPGPLYVPVRAGPAGLTVRWFRTPPGGRTAVAFTAPGLLSAVLGAGQAWVALSAPALRALAEPLGVTAVTVDPRFVAPVSGAADRVAGYGRAGSGIA